jgi:hypothetical protein
MYLDGLPSVKLGSLQDRLRLSAWYRREQFRIFEALINIYANVISTNPDIIKKVESVVDDYIELVVPGSKEYKEASQESFIKKQGSALASIFEKLKVHQTK